MSSFWTHWASGENGLPGFEDGSVGLRPVVGSVGSRPSATRDCGVTDGNLMRGVRFFGHGARCNSLVMSLHEHIIRFVDTVRLDGAPDVVVEF